MGVIDSNTNNNVIQTIIGIPEAIIIVIIYIYVYIYTSLSLFSLSLSLYLSLSIYIYICVYIYIYISYGLFAFVHPDTRTGTTEAVEIFLDVQKAYEVLSDEALGKGHMGSALRGSTANSMVFDRDFLDNYSR